MDDRLIFAVIVVVLFLAINLVLIITLVRKLSRKRSAEIGKKLEGTDILFSQRGASFIGRASAGLFQLRGNGDLFITPDEVFFEMWYPRREVRIPLSSLVSLETPFFFKGRSALRRLLKLTFTDERGREDAVAWCVKDLKKAVRVLRPFVQVSRNVKL